MQTAKLFQNGGSQAIRLPKEFGFEGDEVFIKKIGNATILIPMNNPFGLLVDCLNQFSEDFMDTREQPRQRSRKNL